jgi:hypothetical protein
MHGVQSDAKGSAQICSVPGVRCSMNIIFQLPSGRRDVAVVGEVKEAVARALCFLAGQMREGVEAAGCETSSSFAISSFTPLRISRSPVCASGGMRDVINHLSITSRCHCNSMLLGKFIC